jgi:ABC-type nitrate/sulfonate/bicarbonate transport system permease component
MSEAATPGQSPPRRRFSAVVPSSGVGLVAVLLCLWEASARLHWVQSESWPPVSLVLVATVRGLFSGELIVLLASSLGRAMSGYAIGCGAGIIAGLVLGTSRWLRYAAKPLIEVLRPIPAPAIVPPLILLLGVDDQLKVFVVALACFFPVFTNTLAGVENIDGVLRDTARTFRVGRMRTLVHVIFPGALPLIAAGLRTATGIAIVVTTVAEMIAGSSGLGYDILQMQYALKPEAMYAAVLCLALTGYAANRAFLILEKRAVFWLGQS